MRLDLDGKSVAIGVFTGAALLAAFGAGEGEQPQAGRFQVDAAGSGPGFAAYVIDTATGQVWSERDARMREDFLRPKAEAAK